MAMKPGDRRRGGNRRTRRLRGITRGVAGDVLGGDTVGLLRHRDRLHLGAGFGRRRGRFGRSRLGAFGLHVGGGSVGPGFLGMTSP